jgi:ABC-type nitrate/sulfonate/bicarbonate transport system permease component
MRPLFAIAPLAAMLLVLGPTPHETNAALAEVWQRVVQADAGAEQVSRQVVESGPVDRLAKPGLRITTSSLTTSHALPSFEAGLRR